MPERSNGPSEPPGSGTAGAQWRDDRLLVPAATWVGILARRVRVRGGEVDIVARRGRTLAFVEVKARSSEAAAGMALDHWRLRRVAGAAEQLMTRYARPGDEVRVDAIFIVPRRWPIHLRDIWQG